jgi:hypothetical protein
MQAAAVGESAVVVSRMIAGEYVRAFPQGQIG